LVSDSTKLRGKEDSTKLRGNEDRFRVRLRRFVTNI